MKKLTLLLILLLALSSCAGGSKDTSPKEEAYLPGTDHQYFNTRHIQQTEGGCYFLHESFLYYLDREKQSIYPVCSKLNCLHDKETDEGKLKECHAYLPHMESNSLWGSVMLYQDHIYVSYPFTGLMDYSDPEFADFKGKLHPTYLYRIAQDGSSKDLLLVEDDISQPLIHRGYLYFWATSSTIITTEDENKEKSGYVSSTTRLYRIAVTSDFSRAEVVYTPQLASTQMSKGALGAAGNHVFFTYIPHKDYLEEHYVTYDIHTKAVEDIINSPRIENVLLNGRYFGRKNPAQGETTSESEIIRGDYKGTETETILSGFSKYRIPVSDNRYLYLQNVAETVFEEGTQLTFQVYDENGTFIDEYAYPEEVTDSYYQVWSNEPSEPGGADYQYFCFSEEDTGKWGVYIFDKKAIGSLKGKAFEYTTVYY